jgi:hypothetical protein
MSESSGVERSSVSSFHPIRYAEGMAKVAATLRSIEARASALCWP